MPERSTSPKHCSCSAAPTFLKTLYVLFFIELSTRRVCVAGTMSRPDSAWVTQPALSEWLTQEADTVGRRYASEISRHYRRALR